MLRVRCLGTAFLLTHLQVMALNDIVETVVAHAVLFAELALVHLPELATTDAAVSLTYALDVLHAERLFGKLAHLAVPVLIVGLG